MEGELRYWGRGGAGGPDMIRHATHCRGDYRREQGVDGQQRGIENMLGGTTNFGIFTDYQECRGKFLDRHGFEQRAWPGYLGEGERRRTPVAGCSLAWAQNLTMGTNDTGWANCWMASECQYVNNPLCEICPPLELCYEVCRTSQSCLFAPTGF